MANNTQDKRNAKGGGSVRQRPDGRWEARCTINGKSRSFYADKQNEALKLMRAAQKEKDNGTYADPQNTTVEQWFTIWLEEYEKPAVKPHTYANVKGHINNHIIPSLGKIKLQKLNSTQIQVFLNDMHRIKHYAPVTIRCIYGTIAHGLRQAVNLKYITNNPADACILPKKSKEEITPFSEKDIRAFLDAIETHPLKNLYLVTLFTGMREGEVLGLSWNNVDFRSGTITIKQQLCKARHSTSNQDRYYIGSTKTEKERILTPAPFIMSTLKQVRQQQISDHMAMGPAWENKFNLVFTEKTGRYITHLRVWHQFKRLAAKIGRPDARFHDLRHTYAVTALQEGDNPKTVQENLGHATAKFTMEVYAHVSEKMKKDSSERMQSYFEKINA